MKKGKGQFNTDILLLLAEEIKQPLIAISQLSELGSQTKINAHAKQALSTIDNILLYQRISSGQIALKLEPVHVGSAIQEVSSTMETYMRASGCHTNVKIQRSLEPVDVDRRVLRGALNGLWQTMLNALSGPAEVTCSAKRTKNGIRLSMTSSVSNFDSISFSKANLESSQPLTGLAGPAGDLLAARGMFDLIGGDLKKTEGKKQSGFGVTLNISRQLQIF